MSNDVLMGMTKFCCHVCCVVQRFSMLFPFVAQYVTNCLLSHNLYFNHFVGFVLGILSSFSVFKQHCGVTTLKVANNS